MIRRDPMSIVKIMQRRQVVIPKELVDRDEWYASPQGKKAIATALREIKTGKGKEFATVEELIADLDS